MIETNPLKSLEGKKLEAVSFESGYVNFQFEKLIFSALASPILRKADQEFSASQAEYSKCLRELVGQRVAATSETPQRLEIGFVDHSMLVIPLDAQNPMGPEMATLSGQGRFIAEWTRPST